MLVFPFPAGRHPFVEVLRVRTELALADAKDKGDIDPHGSPLPA
jgi:hypothetical protein